MDSDNPETTLSEPGSDTSSMQVEEVSSPKQPSTSIENGNSNGDSTINGATEPEATKDSSQDMKLVEYNHNEKAERLGRPRNHGLSQFKASSDDSHENESKSKVIMYNTSEESASPPKKKANSKTAAGKITSETLRKKKMKQQTLLPFVKKLDPAVKVDSESTPSKEPSTESELNVQSEEPVKKKIQTRVVKKEKDKSASRTTVLNTRNKLTRQFPGPVTPLHYEMYDENLMYSPKYKSENDEKIALGFNVREAKNADDIIFLVSFVSRFKDIIGIGQVGPQDIEDGLCLRDDTKNVSLLMNRFFARLVTLVLNRPVEVTPKFPGKAISELKPIYQKYGLPREWTSEAEYYEKFTIDDSTQILDEAHPEVLLTEGYIARQVILPECPFYDKTGFEKYGLPGIEEPVERLIMLRTLAQWCLFLANPIKDAIAHQLSTQEIPGDKETYYGPRAIIEGFDATEELTKRTNQKIKDRKYGEDNEAVAKYVEPSNDPLEHTLRYRVDEMVVGDLGFNIGRFYLVRMADKSNGAPSSIATMKRAWSNLSGVKTSFGTKFKLYVQDVHKMLAQNLSVEGIEFDKEGNEVNTTEQTQSAYFYEVAASTDELEAFVEHLSIKLGFTVSEEVKIIDSGSPIYQPLKSLYEYLSGILPLLIETNKADSQERTKRKKVDYSESKQSKEFKDLMEDYDEGQEGAEDLEDEDFEEELDEIANQDDDEDEDYSE